MNPIGQGFIAKLTDNFGLKIISFVTAVFLWMAVLGSRSTEVVKDVPLELNLPSDQAISTELPDRVQFRLSGPRAFLRALVAREEEPIRLDLGGVKPGSVTYRLSAESIRVPIGVKVLGVLPSVLTFQVEQLRTRELPIRLDLRGKHPEGFQLGKVEVIPPTVTIRGPRSKVIGLTEIVSVPIDLSELTASIDRPLVLDLPHSSLKVEGKGPRVTIQLAPVVSLFQIKRVPLEIRGEGESRVRYVNVWIRASPNALKDVRARDFRAFVDFSAQELHSGRKRFAVKVEGPRSPPFQFHVDHVVPDQVDVTPNR